MKGYFVGVCVRLLRRIYLSMYWEILYSLTVNERLEWIREPLPISNVKSGIYLLSYTTKRKAQQRSN